MRKEEYFTKNTLENTDSISRTPPKLYPQERDWTCSIACIRTLLSALKIIVPTEQDFVDRFYLKPGPYYSRDIKALKMLEEYDVIYGCDIPNSTIDSIVMMLKNGYYIMLKSMINYAHWMVLLGIYANCDFSDIENVKMLFFDPYYNELRLLRADEFINMWIDGNYAETKIERDFIAIRGNDVFGIR